MRITALTVKNENGEKQGVPVLALSKGGSAPQPEKERQVSIISQEALDALVAYGNRGLCMRKFFANVAIKGLPPLIPGDILATGDAMLVIARVGKHCFPECEMTEKARCPLQACAFARVERAGQAEVGGAVAIIGAL